jgi:hypothetical protein
MSLLERLAKPPAPNTRTGKLEALLGALEPAEAQALRDALDGPASTEWLADVLASEGHEISSSTIQRYRRRRQQGL